MAKKKKKKKGQRKNKKTKQTNKEEKLNKKQNGQITCFFIMSHPLQARMWHSKNTNLMHHTDKF